MTYPSGFRCERCGWAGRDLRWSALGDSFGRHAGECPACARRIKGCYLSALQIRRRAAERRAGQETRE